MTSSSSRSGVPLLVGILAAGGLALEGIEPGYFPPYVGPLSSWVVLPAAAAISWAAARWAVPGREGRALELIF